MEEKKIQYRSNGNVFKTRNEDDNLYIEGYFVVFDSIYQLYEGATESVDRHAFDETLGGDIRALIDHDTRLVIGRTTNKTLELTVDERGLYGKVLVNPNDQDAMNVYARVQRGDVSQCSFGFEILDEETEFREDNSIHWTIKKVNLFEVSVCTFPAYEETSVKARQQDAKAIEERKAEAWRETMFKKLRKDK